MFSDKLVQEVKSKQTENDGKRDEKAKSYTKKAAKETTIKQRNKKSGKVEWKSKENRGKKQKERVTNMYRVL